MFEALIGDVRHKTMARMEVRPELLRWAVDRAGVPREALLKRFPRLADWESGAAKPTLRQLEEFADATTTTLGYLFRIGRGAGAWASQVPAGAFA
jgi:hypothetical protein